MVSFLPRPVSPPISVLDRPPVLGTPSSGSTSSSGQSLSSLLSTPADSVSDHTPRTSKRNSHGTTPPSAYQRSRYSAPSPFFGEGQDKRSSVLDTLKSIETEWEFVGASAIIPVDLNSSPKSKSKRSSNKAGRKPPPTMATADPSHAGMQKKPSLFRRLTAGGHKDKEVAPPPPPVAPPQLPRLSTLWSDSAAPNVVPQVAPRPAGEGPPSSFLSRSGDLMSGTKFADSQSPPRTPMNGGFASYSLPPGAAPANVSPPSRGASMSRPNGATPPPNGSAYHSNPGSGFRVHSRANTLEGIPVSAPHARPNGTPIATMHRQHNGMANGQANGGPHPLPNGLANGAVHGIPNGSPNGFAKVPPSSPPQAQLKQQAMNGMANGFGHKALPTSPPMAPSKMLPNSPPMAPPKQLHNSTPNGVARPLPTTVAPTNGYANGVPNGVPNGVRGPAPQQNGAPIANGYFAARPGPPPNQQHAPPLPPGATHRSPPMAALASPPLASPPTGSPPTDSKGAFAQQVYSRPPLLDSLNNGQQPQRASPRPLPQVASPPQQHAQLNGGPRNMPSPPAQQARNPYATAAPVNNTPLFDTRGLRPPSSTMQQANGTASPLVAPPARSTSVAHRGGPMSPPTSSRPLPTEQINSGATVHVIASSDPRWAAKPAVAPAPSSTAPMNVAPGPASGSNASRPKISIPTQSTSPPPAPQPYTGPALAAATAATTPETARGPAPAPAAHSQQAPRGSDLMSPIEFASSNGGVPDLRDAKPESRALPAHPPGSHGYVGNGIPPAPPAALANSALPPRTRSSAIQQRRIVSSPLASPAVSAPSSPTRTTHAPASNSGSRSVSAGTAAISRFSAHSSSPSVSNSVTSSPSTARQSKRTSIMDRLRPHNRHKEQKTLTFLCSHPRVVMSLLPFLNINSFLNLLGSDDELRKYISGEMVGRWVMREWGITIERERGRSWPGLTVWEGFLESLLHDPAVYSTYPAQYHNLLRHLSLSHSLIVLFLRTLPSSAFPYAPPLPFEDDLQLPPLHKSSSVGSFHSMGGRRFGGSRPGSRAGSYAGSEAGGGMKPPPRERVTEVVMPQPLSAGPTESAPALPLKGPKGVGRRGSIGSIASAAPSFGFGRKRSNSTSSVQSAAFMAPTSAEKPAAPVPQGKAAFPPVSYPTAKRYEFRSYGGGHSTLSPGGNGGSSSRPGSIASAAGSVAHISSAMASSRSLNTLAAPPPIGGGSRRGARSSLTSSSSKRSDIGGSHSPVQRRWDSPTQSMRVELAFERPPPYMTGRAPILRVFVPVGSTVARWPSADGAAAAWRELEKCGASKRMRLGDLVVNTALSRPSNTEHVLVFVPFVQHKLVPLEYVHCATGHLPHYLDAFALSPTYYDPFLPTPQIIYLDFAPWAQEAMNSVRLAYERRDHTTTSGARISAKRYLHVGGIEVKQGDRVAPEWCGMIALEAEGTAEGRAAMEARFGHGDPRAAVMGPWEVVRDRSMLGSLWLRLITEKR